MGSDHDRSLIKLNKVKFNYSSDADLPILDIPSWTVGSGESVLLIGSSGSGKSTLLKLLSGILACNSGQVSVADHDLESLNDRQRDQFRATQIGYVAQSFNLIPYLSAIDNIKLSKYFAKTPNSSSLNEDDAKPSIMSLESLLLEFDIPKLQWHKPVSQLSVGQQQRVAIARAIVNKPKLLIADEPTSALDEQNRDRFMSLLMRTAKSHNMTLVFVSHDLSLTRYFSRVDSMSDINKLEA